MEAVMIILAAIPILAILGFVGVLLLVGLVGAWEALPSLLSALLPLAAFILDMFVWAAAVEAGKPLIRIASNVFALLILVGGILFFRRYRRTTMSDFKDHYYATVTTSERMLG